jgi:zinc transporter ZupT
VTPVLLPVFIAVGFLHLLGDAVEDMEDFTEGHGNYPFALLFCAFGFLLTLCVDEVGHSLSSGHSHGQGKHASGGFVGEHTPLVSRESDWAHEPELDNASPVIEIELEGGQTVPVAVRKRVVSNGLEIIDSTGYGSANVSGISVVEGVELASPMLGAVTDKERPTKGSLATSIVLTTIFSFHSFFEGLALGIDNNAGSMVETAVGILAHKGLAGFALGVSILHGGMMPKSHYFAVMAVFCCMSPLGIVVGILVSSWTSPFWLACCFSIASGTFLFIGFMEIVMKVGTKRLVFSSVVF